jgi:type II secretory pathway pseudopilin PulG
MGPLFTSIRKYIVIEILIVISILTILAFIGLTSFSGVRKNARDARRQGDIEAIAKALEVNKTIGSSAYNPLLPNQFQGGMIPQEPQATPTYCIAVSTTTKIPDDPTAWSATSACPTSGTWTTIVSGVPAETTKSWKVCALMEKQPPLVFCQPSRQ